MKINSIEIQAIGGIKHLKLKFNDGLNIICGQNGIGKTTILNSISQYFTKGLITLKKMANYELGVFKTSYFFMGKNVDGDYEIKNFNPIKDDGFVFGIQSDECKSYVISLESNRDIPYQKLNSLQCDDRVNPNNSLHINIDYLKNWFVARFAFNDKPDSLDNIKIENFKLACKNFSVIDKNVRFATVDGATFDILVDTPNGRIPFEYLSSGYKTCIYVILGIIKEIEYRFSENPILISNYNGVLLIDEIDLHLHPSWQAQLIQSLKVIFPKAQIIATTHSPSVLQCLEKEEIIVLDIDENNDVYQKDLHLGEYGLQGWTLEEILKDVMGMPSTTSQLYQDTINKFDEALDEENVEDIKKYYNLLLKMLHPNSVTRRLLQIQIAGFEE